MLISANFHLPVIQDVFSVSVILHLSASCRMTFVFRVILDSSLSLDSLCITVICNLCAAVFLYFLLIPDNISC
jgi:uncharacterized protein (DUF486 family)